LGDKFTLSSENEEMLAYFNALSLANSALRFSGTYVQTKRKENL
jgi:hypothetical protein